MKFSEISGFVALLILANLFFAVFGETGCPPAEDIAPCTCEYRPMVRVECANFTSTVDLKQAFVNTKRYTFQEVHVKTSVLPFLPHDVLENAVVKELYVKDTRLTAYFDAPPQGNQLDKLQLENTVVSRAKETKTFRNLKNLKALSLSGSNLPKIDAKLTENIPSSVRELSFVGTQTKSIGNGTFEAFPNLDKVQISSTALTNISRNAFPTLFGARFLYLDDNKLDQLPGDMFTNMPNLQLLSLRNNQLSEIPMSTFSGRTYNVPFIRLEGNPLSCNCLLVWLIRDKPEIIRGTCADPRRLKGRDLQDLRPGDFNC